jgi:hypothetical protein
LFFISILLLFSFFLIVSDIFAISSNLSLVLSYVSLSSRSSNSKGPASSSLLTLFSSASRGHLL